MAGKDIILPIIILGGLAVVGGYFIYKQFIDPDGPKENLMASRLTPPDVNDILPVPAPRRGARLPPSLLDDSEDEDLGPTHPASRPAPKRARITNTMKRLAHSKEYKTRFIATVLQSGTVKNYKTAENIYNDYLEKVDGERAKLNPMDKLADLLGGPDDEPSPNPLTHSGYAYVSI